MVEGDVVLNRCVKILETVPLDMLDETPRVLQYVFLAEDGTSRGELPDDVPLPELKAAWRDLVRL